MCHVPGAAPYDVTPRAEQGDPRLGSTRRRNVAHMATGDGPAVGPLKRTPAPNFDRVQINLLDAEHARFR